MKLTIAQIMAVSIILSGCVTPPAPQPLTDKQISEVNDAALCSLSNTYIDPRIGTEIKSRKLDCDPVSLVCSNQGIKKGTKKFSQCKENQKAAYKLQAQKMANPALGYCLDSGFKAGTEAMATCMAGWSEREQMGRMMQMQQQANQRARMDRAWRNLADSFKQPKPSYTNCNTFGNSISCTTY